MTAVLVTEVGETPTVGRSFVPVRGEVLPPGFPIEGTSAPHRSGGPHPASLVKVTHAALNPIDLHVASGTFFQGVPRVPYVPGVEGVGRIVESESHPPGTRVRFELGHPGFGGNGSMAEFAVVDDAGLVALPETVTDEDATAIGVAGITAGRVLDLADLEGGDTVLVLGATGAIGMAAIQLARHRGGGRVVAAGRDLARLALALDRGADSVVSLGDKSVAELTAEFREAGLGGVDVIIDPLWGDPAVAALAAGNWGVRLVNFGQAAATGADMSSVVLRNNRATVRGISTAMDGFDIRRARYLEAVEYLAAGKLTVDYEIYALEEIEAAWQAQRASPGVRLLLEIQPSVG